MKIGRWEGNEIIYTIDVNGNSVNLMEDFDFAFDILGANMIVDGMVVTEAAVPDMTILISAGIAKDTTVGTFLVGEALVGTVTASDPVNDRRDNVEIRRVIEDITEETRQFKDPITEGITESDIYTEAEYKTEVQINAGTPGASPSAPTTTAGWIKIAEISVLAASLTVVDAVIYNMDAEEAGVANTDWTSDTSLTHRNGTISEMKSNIVTHKNTNITPLVSVHGIQQGTGNGFDADKLDGLHKTEILAVTTVYNITTASDEVHVLPDATATENQQIIKRRGNGSGIVTFTTVDSQTIDTEAPTETTLEGEASIILIPKSGNWESIKTGGGTLVSGPLGETIAINKLVYFDTTGKLMTGDKTTLSTSILAGFLTEAGVLDDIRFVQSEGILDGFTSLTIGSQYFLSTTGGIELSGALEYSDYKVSVGVAVSTTEIDVSIRLPEPTRNQDDGNPVSSFKWFATYKDRAADGYLPSALDNAISQANYPVLFAEIGHIYNQAHIDAGDTDVTIAGTHFYPTPPPGYGFRSGIPDTEVIDATADIDDSTELITLTTADYNQLKIFKSVNGDGVPIRLELISGSLPGGLSADTVYYIRFKTTPDIELYDTEANAINTSGTTGRIDLTDAVGTFVLSQEGIVYDDTSHGHKHTIAVYGRIASTDQLSTSNQDFGPTVKSTSSPVEDDFNNGDPRISNETHGREQIMYAYIKAEHVTTSGEPVSALRYVQDWSLCTAWTGGNSITIPHPFGVAFDEYEGQIFVRDPAVPGKIYNADHWIYAVSDIGQLLNGIDGDLDNCYLQVASSSGRHIQDSGIGSTVPTNWEYKVVLTKPNLVATFADTSFRKVYDISDGTDVTHTLPDASTQLTEQIIKRRGAGAGQVTVTPVLSQKIYWEGEELSTLVMGANSTLVLFPSGGNWEVKDFKAKAVIDWALCTAWTAGNSITINHKIAQAFDMLNGQILVRDPAVPGKIYNVTNIENNPSGINDNGQRLNGIDNDLDNCYLQIGASVPIYVNDSGSHVQLLTTWEYKVVLKI